MLTGKVQVQGGARNCRLGFAQKTHYPSIIDYTSNYRGPFYHGLRCIP